MKKNLLNDRAEEFECDVEKSLVDEHGLLYSLIDINTMRPFPRGYFGDKIDFYRYPGWQNDYNDFTDLLQYENVGMVTGAYLCAQVWKHRATKDPESLEKAYRSFRGIKTLFDMCQARESGYYCKPYGWKLTDQLSSDQYVYSLTGLAAFLQYAAPGERREIIAMIEAMVDWWIRRKYAYPYFGAPLNWPLARFPGFSWLAWHLTGAQRFRDEFDRLCALDEVRAKMPFGGSIEDLPQSLFQWPPQDFETADGRVAGMSPESTESTFLSHFPLLEYDAPHRDLWLEKTRRSYQYGLAGIGADGLAIHQQWFDLKTKTLTPLEDVLRDGSKHPHWHFLGFVGPLKTGMQATMFARAALATHVFLPEIGGRQTAARILRAIGKNELLWAVDYRNVLPDEMKWAGHSYSGDAVTHWLWTYWEGRAKYGMDWHERF